MTRRAAVAFPIAVSLITGLFLTLLPSQAAAGSPDNNVQWNELYHSTPGVDPTQELVPGETYTFRDVHPTGQVYDDTVVTLTFMADQSDLTEAYLRYWDGSEHWPAFAWQKTWTGQFRDQPSRTYDLWAVSIPAHAAGTTVYYRIQAKDGSDTDYLKADNGDLGGNPNLLGQHIRDNLDDPDDWAFTAIDDDVTGPELSNIDVADVGSFEFNVCVDVSDTDTVSGDDDSGVYDDATGSAGQGMYLLWSTDQATVDAGGGSETTMSGAGPTYCSDGQVQPGQATFYFRIYVHNDDADNGLAADRDQQRSHTYDQDGTQVSTAASLDNDVWWTEVLHDTRDAAYRDPFGALAVGTTLTLSVRAAAGDLDDAAFVLYNVDPADDSDGTLDGTLWLVSSTPASSDGTYDYYQLSFTPTATSHRIVSYKLRLRDGSDCDWYIDDHAHSQWDHEDRFENGTGIMVPGKLGDPCSESAAGFATNSFTITVYDSAFTTPEWAHNAVIYQILPDRFRNGSAANDDAWPYDDVYGTPEHLHTTWNEPVDDPRDPLSPYHQHWSADFFGGDLQGIIDELDFFQDLGITALYLNPVFSSPSNHGYDTTDYLQISPRFGDNTLFALLATEAESRGIKIILDGVFNHTGSESRYLDRYQHWDAAGAPATGNDGSGACEALGTPYEAFYTLYGSGGPCRLGNYYDSWWGYDTLPLLTESNEVKDFFFDVNDDDATPSAVIQYWYSLGADGWRFDVADELSHGFWQEFRAQVKGNDGLDGPLYSEVWHEATPWLYGDQMDATMSYRFRKAVLGFLVDADWIDNDNEADRTMWRLSPSQLDYVLGSIREDSPPPAWWAMMNLMGSHDTNRALFVLRERSADLAAAIAKMKLVAAIQMTYPGTPTIYYGDEAGVGARDYALVRGYGAWGAGKMVDGIIQDDPYNRHPYPWDPDSEDPYRYALSDGFASASGELPAGLPSTDLRDHYRRLARTRSSYDVLRTGEVTTLLTDDGNQLYAYARSDANGAPDCAIAVFNRDTSAHAVSLSSLPAVCDGGVVDVLSGTELTAAGGSLAIASLPGLSSMVLVEAFDNPQTADTVASLPPDAMTVSSDLAGVAVSTSTTVRATVSDLAGRSLPAGIEVGFSLLAGSGSLGATTAVTDASGIASVSYTAPATPEIAVIAATITAPGGIPVSGATSVHVGYAAGVAARASVRTGIGPEDSGTMAALNVAATKLGPGEPTLSLARLDGNPFGGDGPAVSPYVSVHLDTATDVEAVVIRVEYTDETGELDHTLWWRDGIDWVNTGGVVDIDANTVTMEADGGSTPSLSDLLNGAVLVVGPMGGVPVELRDYSAK